MKVVCKTNITPTGNIEFNLTVGKVYEVHKASIVWHYVVDDNGAKEHYIEKMFTPLIELRDIRLKELLK
jgi:hypothetical protein